MSEGYECDRCGSLNSGSPHTMISLGDGIPRARTRGLHPTEQAQGIPAEDIEETYDVCPGCRAKFEEWWGEGDTNE